LQLLPLQYHKQGSDSSYFRDLLRTDLPPPGTRVAIYDGIHFRTRKEQDHVRSDQYQSNYVWEGINSYTRESVMVDGSPLTSYGPYMNDGLAFKEANATLVFGTDG